MLQCSSKNTVCPAYHFQFFLQLFLYIVNSQVDTQAMFSKKMEQRFLESRTIHQSISPSHNQWLFY
ncbi:GSCOCG00003323001-RA-CDS [Cotesia congregata]|nr:GSCOCG00003323001-RA-CDS [Cotesia congregata]